MSSYDRRTLLTLIAALPLAACGFTPAYGPGGPAKALLGRVSIASPTDKNEFDLVERLEERLGRTSAGRYSLSYSIRTTASGLAVTPTDDVTRFNIDGRVTYSLTQTGSDKALAGEVTAFTSYSTSGTTVSTVAAREDAFQRLMVILADQIVTRLVAGSAGLDG
jgi:LPS-assembly lipoprotein